MKFVYALVMCMTAFLSHALPVTDMKKVGEAKLSVLFWDVYNSTLFTPDGTFTEGQFPVVLQIDYLRDIEAESLIVKTESEWERLGYASDIYQGWLPQLKEIFPDISEGDQLVLHIDEQGDSAFFYNGDAIGGIDGKQFGNMFLAIWVDENSSYPKVRKRLLGLDK